MLAESQSVGAGVYILLTVWTASLALGVLSVRTGRIVGAVISVVCSLAVSLLLLIPRESPGPAEDRVYDKLFAPRYCTLALLTIGFLGGLGFVIASHCRTPVETKKLRRWLQ